MLNINPRNQLKRQMPTEPCGVITCKTVVYGAVLTSTGATVQQIVQMSQYESGAALTLLACAASGMTLQNYVLMQYYGFKTSAIILASVIAFVA